MAADLEIAAHSAYDIFLSIRTNCQYLGIWNVNFFLTAPFPDYCLLVPF